MFGFVKRFFHSKNKTPAPPRGQAGYIEWLSKHHPAYQTPAQPDEQGGPKGPEPSRYRTWERGGIDVDF